MNKNPFRNELADNTFHNKYVLNSNETWWERALTIVDYICGTAGGTMPPLMSKGDREQLALYIFQFKFMPGGRYIYYAGRQARFYNNCFGGETLIFTDMGWKTLREVAGTTINIMSPVSGTYHPAKVYSHGVQPLNKITFKSVRGHQRHSWTVRATRTHHWPLIDGTDTYDLRVGDVVPANGHSAQFNHLGFAHGFVFGDGNRHGQLRLCADKDVAYLEMLKAAGGTVSYPEFANGDPVVYFNQDVDWKNIPDTNDPGYIASFIKGWLAADGNETNSGHKLCSVNRPALEWFRKNATFAGITITGETRSQIRDIVLGDYSYDGHELFIQSYKHGEDFSGYKVVSIEPDGEEEVFCPFEPVHNRFVLEGNIDTFNCYLLRAEEDTREEWAAVAQRSTSCLMTGGGIGVDYSELRPSGRVLSRTGGTSSGPIPLMYMINEIGRNVMQGGSRRSAIYGSLNWQHEDITDFLRTKNWYDIPAGESTLGAIKENDFNFHAPLDMTNISTNYDDTWLNTKDRELDPVFLENVRQALTTGEPGFSFNFGDKQRETLRNACTEVTSEDDSDVCNLGSVNLGAIDDINEFKDVVTLASKFLVCGTMRAELPYQKVYDVREKNRRLGLGLMGIHEWLLKRSQPYEVTEELHKWLKVYKKESEKSANDHCDRFFLNRPAAYRAIAPTGTIGILAGTTTGIEPLFATAYKRRYLDKGTRWKHMFVVDHTADELISRYDVDPDSIDTAQTLARDPERRIKFQADIQDYVDMSISSTINLPKWGTEWNNEDGVEKFAGILSKYAPRLRGFTVYPDGARGGQPITSVPYAEAKEKRGVVYEETDSCKGGVCGI